MIFNKKKKDNEISKPVNDINENNKQWYIPPKYDEIEVDLNDYGPNKSFRRFWMNKNDQILIYKGNIYVLDTSCIERLNGVDNKLDILTFFKRLKRILFKKKIGHLDFIIPVKEERKEDDNKVKFIEVTYLKDEIVFPITRDKAEVMIEKVKPTPSFLKAMLERKDFQKWITTLPDENVDIKNKNKQKSGSYLKYIIVIGVVSVVVLVMYLTGMLNGILGR